MANNVLLKYKSTFFPVLGHDFSQKDFCPIPLSKGHRKLIGHDVSTYEGLDFYVNAIKEEANCTVAYGGYGEERTIYKTSTHFNSDNINNENERCIHLGIDLWTAAETPVYTPLDGIIHSLKYNANHLDYGGTIITEHRIEGHVFWLLFGHLSVKSLNFHAKKQKILRGDKIGELGNRTENGGWSPHLHLQMITELRGCEGDFQGVASRKEAAEMLTICPSPAVFCGNFCKYW